MSNRIFLAVITAVQPGTGRAVTRRTQQRRQRQSRASQRGFSCISPIRQAAWVAAESSSLPRTHQPSRFGLSSTRGVGAMKVEAFHRETARESGLSPLEIAAHTVAC